MPEVIYENTNYRVDLDREATDEQYLVVNKQHEVVEAREFNKPQALILAKQFDMLLTNDTWSKQLDMMYGGAGSSMVFDPSMFGDDDIKH